MLSSRLPLPNVIRMMGKDILDHFLSRSDWVDGENTVDRVIVGDPELDSSSCLVTWMPSLSALRTMHGKGIPLMICHEPVFWNHHDQSPGSSPQSSRKLNYIQDRELTIVRIHDCWDRWPEAGIPFAWARFLGIGTKPAKIGANGYQHRYDIKGIGLREFALKVADRCSTIGEPVIQVTGDPGTEISRVGIGTGCACDINIYLEMGCDCSVVCDDGSSYWAGIQMAKDMEHPVIRVNHGTSEEPGMISLTGYVNENLEGLNAIHLPHGSSYRPMGLLESGAHQNSRRFPGP